VLRRTFRPRSEVKKMSTSKDTPLSDSVSSTSTISASRTALTEYQDARWSQVAAWAEPPQAPTLNLSPYLHALRRHWAAATAIGLLCAAVAGALVWFVAWPAQFRATVYLTVLASEPELANLTGGRPLVTQTAYEIYKNTQLGYMTNPQVLTAALRSTEIRELPCVKREKDPVAWLQEELRVSYPGEAEIMEVSMTGDDPKAVAKLVQAVVDAYMAEVVEDKRNEQRTRLQKLNDVLTETENEVRGLRNDQSRLAEQLGTPASDVARVKQESELRLAMQLNQEYLRVRLALQSAQEDLKGQQTLLDDLPNVEISVGEIDAYGKRTDPQFRQMVTDLAYRRMDMARDRSVRINSNSAGVSRSDQELQAIEAQLEPLRAQLNDEIRATRRAEYDQAIREKAVEVNAYAAQEAQLKADVARQQEEVKKIGGKSVDLEMYETQIANKDAVFSGLTAEREDLRVKLRSEARRISILQRAAPPLIQYGLEVRIAVTVLAILATLCVPGLGIVWWDSRSKRVNSAEDVSKGIGATVLGSLPVVPARVIRRLGSPSKQHRNWHLRLTESVDGVAARLLRQAEMEQARIVLITSAVGGEGKTTLATQLAMSLARSGHRTVLVDFDLRRPAFDEIFGLPLEPGVSETLRGENDFTQPVAHETGTNNLAVVTAGHWDRHALAALANGAAGALLEKLRAEYEFVVVDSSPVLPVADTRFVSQYVDTVILSVFRDVSQIPKVEAACDVLRAFGCGSLATVVIGPTEGLAAKDLGYEPRLLESA
ncbi:MAG: hypothetical protein A2V70_11725, partial [Planctomycetes bacterium RBG_13_63_9]